MTNITFAAGRSARWYLRRGRLVVASGFPVLSLSEIEAQNQ
jgi:hypothetical protein